MAPELRPFVTGALVGTLCMVALMATNQGEVTNYAAPSTAVSSQTSVVPSMATMARAPLAAADVDYAPVEATSDYMPVDTQVEVQGNSWSTTLAGLLAVPLAAAGLFMFKNRTDSEEKKELLVSIDDLLSVGKQAAVVGAVVGASALAVDAAQAYPIFAQQGFANPREATGRIVCANCHLAAKETEIELPQAVLPDQVFEAVAKIPYTGNNAVSQSVADPNALLAQVTGTVEYNQGQPMNFVQESGIPVSQALVDVQVPSTPNTVFKATIKVPYDKSLKQVNAKGKPADLNVGAVLILPEGFRLAPPERIPESMKEEMKGLQFIQYSESQPNILVAGPVPGKLYEEMVVPLLSPDPATNKNVHYGTLPVYVGGNRGRGQLYPTGEKSNNNAYTALHAGKIADIQTDPKSRITTIAIEEPNNLITNEELPAGAEVLVKKGDVIEVNQPLTTNPNVGGFGQTEDEIVLQDPNRVLSFLFFSVTALLTQSMLVIKKKQWEQVQIEEMK